MQTARLAAFGVGDTEIGELLRYDENRFDVTAAPAAGVTEFPLADEPFVECWQRWADEARERGAWAVLSRRLPQLAFPIADGMRDEEDYRAATLRGVPASALAAATGLGIERPDLLELEVYPSFAGRVPVLTVRHRPDFVRLAQALAKRNQPLAIPDGQGALMISGYNNWRRIGRLRQRWERLAPDERRAATWSEEFARIRPHKELYQDRFMILTDGPYSAVPAADLGLAEGEWRRLSLLIRREHECCHYFTRRLYGSMRNHLLDEIVADYTGIVAAVGRFRGDWLLRFLAPAADGDGRTASRLELYRGSPPLSDHAFVALGRLVTAAASNLERFDRCWPPGPRSLEHRALAICALASRTLLDLALGDGLEVPDTTSRPSGV